MTTVKKRNLKLTKKSILDTVLELAQSKATPTDIVVTKNMLCLDAGIDSLNLVELSYEIEELYEVDIDPAKMAYTEQTLGALADVLFDIIIDGKKK